MRRKALVAPDIPRINGIPSSSAAIVAGDTIYLSGHTAGRSADGTGVAGKGQIDVQIVRTFERLKDDLAALGSSLDDVVKITVYVTDRSYRAPFQEIRVRYFGDPPPASTFVVVAGLAHPDLLIEMEAIAVLTPSK